MSKSAVFVGLDYHSSAVVANAAGHRPGDGRDIASGDRRGRPIPYRQTVDSLLRMVAVQRLLG